MYTPPALRALTDEALLSRLEELVRQEREGVADIVEHITEVDRREVTLDRGFPSLFDYCVKKLGYSESAAFLRIRAARAAGEFPEIVQRLRSGRLHLEGIARLYPHMTSDNGLELLDRVDGATKREVVAFVATLQSSPPPDRDVIIPVPATLERRDAAASAPKESSPQVIPPPSHRFHFTGDEELLSMIERLRGLLRHKHPDGRLEDIFKEAARALLGAIERTRMPTQRRAATSQAGAVPRSFRAGGRLVPRAIKREVWARDGGRCAFTAPDGRRCESSDALEYDHIVPWADGGRSDTADNIRLLCRAHNQRLGRRRFGPRRRLC